jgi:hypothetical protein
MEFLEYLLHQKSLHFHYYSRHLGHPGLLEVGRLLLLIGLQDLQQRQDFFRDSEA